MDNFRLSTYEWSWLDDSWKVENIETDEGWSYALDIKGPYDVDAKRVTSNLTSTNNWYVGSFS